MTRNSRDHRAWTNRELEADPQGYLAAQQAYREDQAAEQAKQLEEHDRAEFERQFVAAGGTKSEAEREWQRYRTETAAAAARRADREAAEAQRARVRARL